MNSDALRRFESFLATPELPFLGPAPRASRMSLDELNGQLSEAFAETDLNTAQQRLVRSLLLLWHDHLDESHSLSQEIHSADGSFLHGIMHRREPDYFNAKYWFHRVGQHPAFPLMAQRTAELLKARGESVLEKQLLPGGRWNPDAFVDLCERETASRSGLTNILQQVQEIECRTLLEHFCEGAR